MQALSLSRRRRTDSKGRDNLLSLLGWELPIPLLGINPDDAIAILWQKVRKMVLDHLIDLLGKIQSSHRYRSVSLSPTATLLRTKDHSISEGARLTTPLPLYHGQLSFVRVFFLLPFREPIMRGAEEEGVTYCTTIGFFPQVEEQESYSPVSRSSTSNPIW